MAKAFSVKHIDLSKLDARSVLTVKLNITKEFKFRLFIAKALIFAACKVLGCGLEIVDKNESS